MYTPAPVLASKDISARERLVVYGGLHYLKGNSLPYFALTGEIWVDAQVDRCGCIHGEILQHFPRFKNLAALHLSDINGEPMHVLANGWYYLAGALPDPLGTEYHYGNSKGAPPEYRLPTKDECLAIFAEHCRIDMAEARSIADSVWNEATTARHSRNAIARDTLAELLNAMRPRWKNEAGACIAEHNLVIYGNPWPSL